MARRGRTPAGYVSLNGRGQIVLSNGHVRDHGCPSATRGTAELRIMMPASATSASDRRRPPTLRPPGGSVVDWIGQVGVSVEPLTSGPPTLRVWA
jgi:hypothetical protein